MKDMIRRAPLLWALVFFANCHTCVHGARLHGGPDNPAGDEVLGATVFAFGMLYALYCAAKAKGEE